VGHVGGVERGQATMFPQSLDECIGEDNPVRFIDAFVASLNLVELGFVHAAPEATGRPPYDPGDLLRLYLYGYLNRVRSSRALEKETRRNVEAMWLLRKLTPDFKTIADFRADNRAVLTRVCKEFVALCKRLDLFGGELVAVDGSKFRASNSRERLFTQAKLAERLQYIEEQIRGYLEELDRNDQQQAPEQALSREELQARIAQLSERRQRYSALQATMEQHQLRQIALTDPDARLMRQSSSQGGGTVVAYNVQTVVDAKHKLIVTHAVTTEGSDQRQLTKMAMQAQAALGVERLEVVADKGYYDGDEVAACAAAGISAYIAKPNNSSKSLKAGRFGKPDFTYDVAHDRYRCPAGEWLSYRFTATQQQGRKLKHYYTAAAACARCELRSRCTDRLEGARQVTRLVNEEALEAMAQRVAAAPHKLKLRKQLVEHPFGTLKRPWNQGYFLLRSLAKVRAEMSLSVLAYNLRRVLNILGTQPLIAALATATP
jgi:transposase